MITKDCKYCKNSFETKDNRKQYCDSSCSAKNNNAGVNRWSNVPYAPCPECGKDVARRSNKYCSRECSHKHVTFKRYGSYNKLVEKECANCFNTFMPSTKHVIYCSPKCLAIKKRQEKIDAWLKDSNTATVKDHGLSRPIRQYLLEQAGFKCSMPDCGWGKVNPVTGNVPLEIEHIDGDCMNNHPDNLIVLCPNCHSLTPTYRALNKGNSTRNRK